MKFDSICFFCQGQDFKDVFHYSEAPKGETTFNFSSGVYDRKVICCGQCQHYYSLHSMDMTSMYEGDYVNATYKDGLKKVYDKINALPANQSDNVARVKNIVDFLKIKKLPEKPSLLDVGSGLGVFPYRMKNEGWDCTALDPDPRSSEHAEKEIGIKTITGIFGEVEITQGYDLITFNKVLEHVEDPVALLTYSKSLLNPGGCVYVELPDGEKAVEEGPGRQEFFIDHHHIFSEKSFNLLCELSGFKVEAFERLREPSTKFTLRSFAIQ